MWTFFGGLLIVLAIVLLVIRYLAPLRKEDQQVPNGHGEGTKTLKAHPKLLTGWKWWLSLIVIVLGIGLTMIPKSYFEARQGHQYYVVSIFGTISCYYTPGIKLMIPYSTVQEWEKFIDVKTVAQGEPTDGIDGIISDYTTYTARSLETDKVEKYTLWGIGGRFNDQVRGNVRISARIQLPQNDKDFEALVEDFRHPKNLVNNTLIPTVKEQVINACYMFSAEDYVSGEAANFRQALDDALKIGGLAVDRKERPDTIYAEIGVNKVRKITDIRKIVSVKPKLDENGHFIRVPHDITKNKLLVSQVIVDIVNLEPKFQQKLEKQRDISAQKSIEIQLTETAEMEQQRIVAQGERDKAGKRVEEEKKQVATLIAIETDKKREVTNKELAVIQLETAKLKAKAIKVTAEAEAYEKKVKMQADGALEQKLAAWENAQKFWANSQKGVRQTPTYTSGANGKGGGAQDYMNLLFMNQAKQLGLNMDMSTKK